MTSEEIFYESMRARDHRFDGKFFVGVKRTGVYCRPVCTVKAKREGVEFFKSSSAAKRSGYRPCLRCRPESAPLSPAWIGRSAVVQRALKSLHGQEGVELSEDELAAELGVSARHLRRLFIDEIGKTPRQIASEIRLGLAKKLIVETRLSTTDIAFALGYKSLPKFNDEFKTRFKKSPGKIRRAPLKDQSLGVTLAYRPPFDYAGLVHFYKTHEVGRLEWFEGDTMHRVIEIDHKVGKITIANDAAQSRLKLEIDFPDASAIRQIIAKVRAMFDLDSDPIVVANILESDPAVKRIYKKHPGIRLPSGWDPFEIAISTILGQLVSVTHGKKLVAELVELLGNDSGILREGQVIRLFPSPQAIALSNLDGLGTTKVRKRTLVGFSKAVAEGSLSLDSAQDVDGFVTALLEIPGIGPWTASYMALKILRHADAFPNTDLILARALELHPKETLERMRPWRGYAASLFWREYADKLVKKPTTRDIL